VKIALAIQTFDPSKGGAERYAFDLSNLLSRKGHEVSVFCSRGIEVPGVATIAMPVVRYPKWFRTLAFALKHRRWIEACRPDIVLGFGNTFEANVYQSHGGIQRVWMEREIASYDNPAERVWRAALLRTSLHQKMQEVIARHPFGKERNPRVVAISEMVRNHLAAHYGLDEAAIDVVYNGVDTVRFRPAESKGGGPLRILFSAGNFRLKGLMPLIKALSLVAAERHDFVLLVMGRGKRGRYEAPIRDSGLQGRVTFLGETPSPEAIYRDAHILAHPTYYDACSLTTMEAMAAGLPVITTQWNGASSLISRENGFVIDDPSDTEPLRQAIMRLFDGSPRESMGRQARETLEGFTMARNADRMEQIFFEVADGKE
jgi:UDP-glucose:(heptosyl)LPS alpha-1,3-glucosyltransferase